jgi:hypothetical protein
MQCAGNTPSFLSPVMPSRSHQALPKATTRVQHAEPIQADCAPESHFCMVGDAAAARCPKGRTDIWDVDLEGHPKGDCDRTAFLLHQCNSSAVTSYRHHTDHSTPQHDCASFMRSSLTCEVIGHAGHNDGVPAVVEAQLLHLLRRQQAEGTLNSGALNDGQPAAICAQFDSMSRVVDIPQKRKITCAKRPAYCQ